MSEPKKITVGMVAKALPCAPLWIAQHSGMFTERNLDVSYEALGSGDLVTEALRDGRFEIALTTPEGTISDRRAGGTLTIIAGLTNQLPFKLIGSASHHTIESLRGGRIGVSSINEGTIHVVKTMLARNGLNYPDDYTFDVVGTHVTRWDLLQKGEIDAGLQLTPYDHIAVDAGFPNLGDPADYIPEFAFIVAAADQRWCETYPDETRAFLDGLRSATDLLYNSPASVVDVVAQETDVEPRFVARCFDDLTTTGMLPRDLKATRRALEAVAESMTSGDASGLIATLADVVDETYLPK